MRGSRLLTNYDSERYENLDWPTMLKFIGQFKSKNLLSDNFAGNVRVNFLSEVYEVSSLAFA
jgi:hypothetical protein